jgi:alginate O-acetyltransferase complex protein AlgI
MVLGGLWHGAAWTFVLWGLWHGLWLAVERVVVERAAAERGSVHPPTRRAGGIASRTYALAIVLIGWVLFRAPDLAVASAVLLGMIGGNGVAVTGAMAWQLDRFSLSVLAGAIVVIVRGRRLRSALPQTAQDVVYALLFVFSILKLAAEQYSPFLYFQF